MSDTIEGTLPGTRVGESRPKTTDEKRECFCGVRISMYNPHSTCWVHSPVKRPRVRGRKE